MKMASQSGISKATTYVSANFWPPATSKRSVVSNTFGMPPTSRRPSTVTSIDTRNTREVSAYGDECIETSQQDIYVRIGSMIDASTFWVIQLPRGNVDPESVGLALLFKIEKTLAVFYEEGSNAAFQSCSIDDLKPGLNVGVREYPDSMHWYRGLVIRCRKRGHQLVADVFLIDYGVCMTNVPVSGCVRKMPMTCLNALRPLSFIVRISSVCPSIEAKAPETTQEAFAQNWPPEANAFVQNLLLKSKTREARIFDWQHDLHEKQVYGNIQLLDYPGEVNLRDILLEKGLAKQIPGAVRLDAWVQVPTLMKCRKSDEEVDDADEVESGRSFAVSKKLSADLNDDTLTRSDSEPDGAKGMEPYKDSDDETAAFVSNVKELVKEEHVLLPAGIDIGNYDKEVHKRRKEMSNGNSH